MKLSTRLKKTVSAPVWAMGNGAEWFQDFNREHYTIRFLLDCKEYDKCVLLNSADQIHRHLIENGCTLLLKECPVINGNHEIILHYTSTTYKEWCNR